MAIECLHTQDNWIRKAQPKGKSQVGSLESLFFSKNILFLEYALCPSRSPRMSIIFTCCFIHQSVAGGAIHETSWYIILTLLIFCYQPNVFNKIVFLKNFCLFYTKMFENMDNFLSDLDSILQMVWFKFRPHREVNLRERDFK